MTKTSPDVPGTWEYQEPPRPKLQKLAPGQLAAMHELDRQYGSRMAEAAHYVMGNLKVVVVQEPAGKGGEWLWHLSISHPKRHPTWDELKAARYWLLPEDRTFGILLPPAGEYVNVPQQDHVFHLWEVADLRATERPHVDPQR